MPTISLTSHVDARKLESARYVLLRRLAPTLRHDIASALQPISILSMLIEKKLQKSPLELPTLARNAAQLSLSARDAASTCMKLMSWLEPSPGDLVTVANGVEDAAKSLQTEFSLRGFCIVTQTEHIERKIPRSITCCVLTAALIAFTDALSTAGEISIAADIVDNNLLLRIYVSALHALPTQSDLPTYRKLEWDEALVLAQAELVQLTYDERSFQVKWSVGSDSV